MFLALFKYALPPAVSLLAVSAITPHVGRLFNYLGIVDKPGPRRLHLQAVPRGVGIVIAVGTLLSTLVSFQLIESLDIQHSLSVDWFLEFWIGALIVLGTGVLDDILHLPWPVKLLGQIAAASAMFILGARFDGAIDYTFPWYLAFVLTIAWYLLFINAINLIDGLDGLASGIAVISSVGLAAASIMIRVPGDALFILGFGGACLGFLRYNFHPARVFLGDAGSHFIGFTLATFGLVSGNKGATLAVVLLPLFAIGIPVFDTLLAIWRRTLRGLLEGQPSLLRSLASADSDHIHHRLMRLGLTQEKVALFLYLANALLVGLGLLTISLQSRSLGIFLLAFLAGSYVVVRHIAKEEVAESGKAILRGVKMPSARHFASVLYPLVDGLCLFVSLLLAYFLRSQLLESSTASLKAEIIRALPIWVALPFMTLVFSGVYQRVWSRARTSDFGLLIVAVIGGCLISASVTIIRGFEPPLNVLLLTVSYLALAMPGICLSRVAFRLIQDCLSSSLGKRSGDWPALLVGASTRALPVCEELLAGTNFGPVNIIGIVDDDENLLGRVVMGKKVLGSISSLQTLFQEHKFKALIVAPGLDRHAAEAVVEFGRRRELPVLSLKLELQGSGTSQEQTISQTVDRKASKQ